jgi:hypothetical protein
MDYKLEVGTLVEVKANTSAGVIRIEAMFIAHTKSMSKYLVLAQDRIAVVCSCCNTIESSIIDLCDNK